MATNLALQLQVIEPDTDLNSIMIGKNDSQMYHLKLYTLWSPLKKDGYIGIVGYFDTVK